MPLAAIVYTGLLIVGALTALGLTWHGLRVRAVPGATMFAVSQGAVFVWSLSALVAYLSVDLDHKVFWTNLQYFGITLVPMSWLVFVLQYTGHGSWLNRRLLALLCIHPVVTLVLVWTNPWHHLFRQRVWLDVSGPMPILGFKMGPAFWVHTVYSYLLLLFAAYLLVLTHVQALRVYRRQTLALLIAVLGPWAANVATLSGMAPLTYLDITPLAFAVSGVAVGFGLLRQRLLDLVPIAHDTIIREMTIGVIVLDLQERIVEINTAAQAILGVDATSAVGRVLSEVVPHYGYLLSRYRSVRQVRDEVTIGNGVDERVYDFQLAPLRDVRRHVVGQLITIQDVTRRKEAERALSRHAERLRILHEIDRAVQTASSVEAIAEAVLDHCRHLLPVSRARVFFLDVGDLGFPRILSSRGSSVRPDAVDETVLNRLVELVADGSPLCFEDVTNGVAVPEPVRSFCAPDTRSCLLVPLRVQKRLIGLLSLEYTAPGSYVPWMIDMASQIATSLAVASENVRLYEAAQRELAERRQLERALRQSERAAHQRAEDLAARNAELDAFAHTVAHDLKAPLSLLLGYTSFIEAGEVTGDETQLHACIHAIGESARKMGSIIDELLLLASVRKAEEVELQPLDMAAIVEAVLVRFSDVIEQQQVEVVLPPSWPIAWGYVPWVEEIWVNYFSNAIKYGGNPPRIEMGGYPVDSDGGPMARFWIRDNGDGLSPDEQARLFVPFERLRQARAQGHGLGLSIVRRIVERLGGEAGVESPAIPGQGCTFYFTLPLADLST